MAETVIAATGAGTAAAADAAPIVEIVDAPKFPDPPYNAETLAQMETFFKGRAKNPAMFTYTVGGNFETKEGAVLRKRGRPMAAGTVNLKRFMPMEPAQRVELEEARLMAISQLEEEYEKEMLVLRQAHAAYKVGGSMREVMEANQRVTELSARLSAARFAVRDIEELDNPVTKSVLFSEPYEERKLFPQTGDFFDRAMFRMMFYEFKPEMDQGIYVADEAVAAATAAAAEQAAGTEPTLMAYQQKMRDGRVARVFFETDSEVNGFLSPMWPVEFVLDDTKYFMAIQAYEALRMKELGKKEIAEQVLKTRKARTIRLLVLKEKGEAADARGLWMKIFTAVYQQHPVLKEKLLATGTDALVYADGKMSSASVGLAEKDSGVLDSARWKGENLVGVAQEAIRTRLREETLEEAPAGAAQKGGTITEEEVNKNRVGAIVNVQRQKAAMGGGAGR